MWMLTGTPLTSSERDLYGTWHSMGCPGRSLLTARTGSGQETLPGPGPELVSFLRKLMIRHSKSMRIGGEVALSLPEADCDTVWLTMSGDERMMYESACDLDSNCTNDSLNNLSRLGLEMRFQFRRQTCANWYTVSKTKEYTIKPPTHRGFSDSKARRFYSWLDDRKHRGGHPNLSMCTKIRALRDDLLALMASEPGCHAVIFTHHAGTHDAIVRAWATTRTHSRTRTSLARSNLCPTLTSHCPRPKPYTNGLKALCSLSVPWPATHHSPREHVLPPTTRVSDMASKTSFKVLEFCGRTGADARHRAIRTFQEGVDQRVRTPTVIVVTVKTGSVGITLTAASRVYLFEPMLDPAEELQAAGRIHRLGQTKDILIRRFCFKDTVEEQVVHLHKEIKEGRMGISNGMFPAGAVRLLGNSTLDRRRYAKMDHHKRSRLSI